MIYLRKEYLSLPSKSGVYTYLDREGKILYVGKALDLKNRVSSYFANPELLLGKTKMLVAQIEKIRITLVESELEALLLEAFYIKKYKPKYNVLMKDSKAYIMIRITVKDPYPKILLARKEDDPHSVYFGPYPNAQAVRSVLKTIRKIFPYQSILNHPKRICLYHHLGLCPCPPMFDSPELKKTYKKNIRGIIRILEGESQKIMKELEKERDAASKKEQYEEALAVQKKITAMSLITRPFHRPIEYDVNPNLRTDIRQEELEELKKILNEAMTNNNVIPDSDRGSMDSRIRGNDKNNKPYITKLNRIECYDISNIQGTNATGSLVVLTNGEVDTSQYRRFKIRREWEKSSPVSPSSPARRRAPSSALPNQSAPNDFAMMNEVLKRRFAREGWESPDLVIVDGGKGQVSAALEALASRGVTIPLIGLAKREETIIVPSYSSSEQNESRSSSRQARTINNLNFYEISLPKSSKALHLIMRIRDEAHRFAITYHRKLRSKQGML